MKKHFYAFVGVAVGASIALILVAIAVTLSILEPSPQEKCQKIADTYGYLQADGSENGCMVLNYRNRWIDTSHLSRADLLNYKEKHA